MGTDVVAVAFMSHGAWVARCPRLFCMNAEKRGLCDDGSMGGLEAGRFTCRTEYGGCGFQCAAQWPPNIADLERVLLARPMPLTRNWQPGETVEQLIAENFEHGLLPATALEAAQEARAMGGTSPRLLMQVVDDEVIRGALTFAPRAEIEGR